MQGDMGMHGLSVLAAASLGFGAAGDRSTATTASGTTAAAATEASW